MSDTAGAREILDKVSAQGLVVRDKKTSGASKDEITAEVQALLALKKEYKALTGEDVPGAKPSKSKKDKKKKEAAPAAAAAAPPAAAPAAAAAAAPGAEILAKITAQGLKIRDMKVAKAAKDEITAEVQVLLALKKEYKDTTGEDVPAPAKGGSKKDKKKAESTETPAVKTEGGLSKKEANKLKKKAQKDAAKTAAGKGPAAPAPAASAAAATSTAPAAADAGGDNYGYNPIVRSSQRTGVKYTLLSDMSAAMVGQRVRVRGRLETVRAKSSKLAFAELRQRWNKVQALCSVGEVVTKEMIKFLGKIPPESVIDIEGVVVAAEVTGCTINDCEIHFDKCFVISKSAVPLPLQISDASRPEGDPLGQVNQDTRLNNRWVDLRTTTNQAIFRVQSGICMLFREYLLSQGFQEIHTPKIIPAASEGGADVFSLQYFDTTAYLAQSPQLYKQMAINSDFDRVFEIGPVFRSEDSHTHRHLCEFTGLDLEMAFMEHYHEVLEVIDGLFVHMFKGLQALLGKEIEVIRQQFDREPFEFLVPSLRLEWPEAIEMLRDAGEEVEDFADIDTRTEKRLGTLVKAKYHTDFYMLDKFPLHIRPFYTMPDPVRKGYSNSYDLFMRGEEIMSGAQRVHDADLLVERATELGVPLETIKDYIASFKYGSFPHAGGGVGMERVAMLFLGLPNIRKTSMFPRDPNRNTP